MTDRRTPLFPLQALRIADVRSPVACEKPHDAQLELGICNNFGELCYGSELQFGLYRHFLATSALGASTRRPHSWPQARTPVRNILRF